MLSGDAWRWGSAVAAAGLGGHRENGVQAAAGWERGQGRACCGQRGLNHTEKCTLLSSAWSPAVVSVLLHRPLGGFSSAMCLGLAAIKNYGSPTCRSGSICFSCVPSPADCVIVFHTNG